MFHCVVEDVVERIREQFVTDNAARDAHVLPKGKGRLLGPQTADPVTEQRARVEGPPFRLVAVLQLLNLLCGLAQTTDVFDTVRDNIDMLTLAFVAEQVQMPADDGHVVTDVMPKQAVEDHEPLLALFLLRDVGDKQRRTVCTVAGERCTPQLHVERRPVGVPVGGFNAGERLSGDERG
ncbi:hypothetical protein [Haloarcula sp. Atlit-120R]|uniref:hypothetical protein n=1 Tax=Haloarcula sp. Atlit-120R TaxID=2282135 RepID=UPI001F40A76C|nr:hypothetical protein [Haloarcula sp. Atlit-120R]